MSADLHESGKRNILAAVESALVERRVEGARVSHESSDSAVQTLHVTISVGDKSDSQSFSAAEIDDCGQAIDAPAALKVRMLVSQFVR